MLHFPECPHPFLPALPPCWWKGKRKACRTAAEERAPCKRGWGHSQPHSHLASHEPAPLTRYRACVEGWQAEVNVQGSLQVIKALSSFDPVIPLLGIVSKEIIQRKKDALLFIAVLFIRRKWKQMPCPRIER